MLGNSVDSGWCTSKYRMMTDDSGILIVVQSYSCLWLLLVFDHSFLHVIIYIVFSKRLCFITKDITSLK